MFINNKIYFKNSKQLRERTNERLAAATEQEEVLYFNFSQRAFAVLCHELHGANSYIEPDRAFNCEGRTCAGTGPNPCALSQLFPNKL